VSSWTHVRRDNPPWLPTADATDLSVIHMHDMPLLGTFLSEGSRHAFACLRGVMEHVSLWVYAPVASLQTAAGLKSARFESTDEAFEAVLSAMRGAPLVLALSVDDRLTYYNDYEADAQLDNCIVDFLKGIASLRQEQERVEYLVDNRQKIVAALSA
jgi:hypothetical protein